MPLIDREFFVYLDQIAVIIKNLLKESHSAFIFIDVLYVTCMPIHVDRLHRTNISYHRQAYISIAQTSVHFSDVDHAS